MVQASAKYCWCGSFSLCCGFILVIVAIMVPPFLDGVLFDQAPYAAALQRDNQDSWSVVPGENDILVARKQYVYACNNPEDVMMLGARPEVTELGPYHFRISSQFSKISYHMMDVPFNSSATGKREAI
jgi:hypothetical protein